MATPPKKPTDGTSKPPAPRKPATPRKTTTRKAAAPAAKAPAKVSATRKPPVAPAAAKPVTAAAPKKPAARRAPAARKPVTASTGKKWGIAAVVGGFSAAVTAGLLALRGSTPSDDLAKPNDGKKAHQADGTDSSKSFDAGIADEGTVPE